MMNLIWNHHIPNGEITEIYAASVALNEILHLSYIVEEMGSSMGKPIVLKIDNTAAIAFANGRVRRSKLKHIDVRQEWVQALRDHSVVKTEYVNTKFNKADFFTKILDTETFLKPPAKHLPPKLCTSTTPQ